MCRWMVDHLQSIPLCSLFCNNKNIFLFASFYIDKMGLQANKHLQDYRYIDNKLYLGSPKKKKKKLKGSQT